MKFEVENDGSYIVGTWDKNNEMLLTKDKTYRLSIQRYSELNNENRIKTIKYVDQLELKMNKKKSTDKSIHKLIKQLKKHHKISLDIENRNLTIKDFINE